ncbi:hypothetical protein [Peribacillus simplex]|uniref:hypothetical protein n=1 Tax=Peribacillus simplex TaxID=1478 RepID=UPI0028681444|nr:hypothetical protein [Peribacillus simplex]
MNFEVMNLKKRHTGIPVYLNGLRLSKKEYIIELTDALLSIGESPPTQMELMGRKG